MDRDDCGCKAKGRLLLHVESKIADKVKVELIEESQYRDIYIIPIKNGIGRFRVERIAMGELTVRTDLGEENVIYYPNNKLLFEKNNYVHKLTILDRRK